MTDIPLQNVRTIVVCGEDVILDPKRLQFNETNLGTFMEELSLWYDYYSSKSALAESEYETNKAKKFLEGKEAGLSDKAAESFATADPDVKSTREASKQLKDYLRSLDKAADLAMNRGHMLRKEMDKLGLHLKNEIDVSDILGT